MSTTDANTTASNPLTDLTTGFLRDALVVIDSFDDRPSGQMVMDELEETGGYENINHGQLYPNLDKLVRAGYVEKGELDRRTNYYAITSDGEQALESYVEFVTGE